MKFCATYPLIHIIRFILQLIKVTIVVALAIIITGITHLPEICENIWHDTRINNNGK